MKKLLLVLALSSTIISVAQEARYTRHSYLSKSRNQKTVGRIMLACGTGLIFTGVIVGNQDHNNHPNDLLGPNLEEGLWLFGGGLAIGVASIPFFVSSANNARKAAFVSLINQKIIISRRDQLILRSQPAISLRFNLRETGFMKLRGAINY